MLEKEEPIPSILRLPSEAEESQKGLSPARVDSGFRASEQHYSCYVAGGLATCPAKRDAVPLGTCGVMQNSPAAKSHWTMKYWLLRVSSA